MTEASRAVFVSHASEDSAAAQRICAALRAAGVEVWLDQSELRGGDAWDQMIRRQIKAAGISVEGLIELIDIAERLPVLPIKAKLAELKAGERHLRVFDTADAAVLTVFEKGDAGRSEYGIERDPGLVADLALFARAQANS